MGIDRWVAGVGGQAARARAFVEAEHRSVKQLEEDKDSRSITLVAKRSSLGELPALGNGTDSGGGFSSGVRRRTRYRDGRRDLHGSPLGQHGGHRMGAPPLLPTLSKE